MTQTGTVWANGDAYERFMGRWSRRIAERFADGLDASPGLRWLDVGCGTGALSGAVLERWAPASLVGVDPAEGFLEVARARFADLGDTVRFERADAAALPLPDASVDAVVSGLVLNFVDSPERAVAEMTRVLAPGGLVAIYQWDFTGGMPLLERFWDAAVALDPAVAPLHEDAKFGHWTPAFLRALLTGAPGVAATSVVVEPIEVAAVFADFDDYWTPFLGGQGPGPSYAMSLDEARRSELRERLRGALPVAADGTITLTLRAWKAVARTVGGAA